jgi:hypothetical protein
MDIKRSATTAAPTAELEEAIQPSGSVQLLWFLLPAFASLMLLATTNLMCQEVAVVPFLWVLPLGLYLISFIVCLTIRSGTGAKFFTPAGYISPHGAPGVVVVDQCSRRKAGIDAEHGFFRLLHGLPRGTGAAKTTSELLDAILFVDLGWRGCGRAIRRACCSPHF